MEVTEAPSVHRATELVCQFYQQFIYKAFTSKQLSRICTLYLRRSLCRRHLCDIALPPSLRYSVCLLYKTFSYHSIFRKNLSLISLISPIRLIIQILPLLLGKIRIFYQLVSSPETHNLQYNNRYCGLKICSQQQ